MATAQKNPRPKATTKTSVDEAREAIKKAKEVVQTLPIPAPDTASFLGENEATFSDAAIKKGKEVITSKEYRAKIRTCTTDKEVEEVAENFTAIIRKGKATASYLAPKTKKEVIYTSSGQVETFNATVVDRSKKPVSFHEAFKAQKTFSNKGTRLYWIKDEKGTKSPVLRLPTGDKIMGEAKVKANLPK